jgi:putative ATPase
MTRKASGEPSQPSVFEPLAGRPPLAARMRPRALDEVAGQQHLLALGKGLRVSIEAGDTGSILFWGPPGTGKTTLARLIARYAKGEFVPFSAVTDGIPRLREIMGAAERRLATGARTILFIDEIHRFNKGQQDALLPHVEGGLVTLIGATTENPSFELNGALLSRMRVYVLQPIGTDDIAALIRRALTDKEHGLGVQGLTIADDALALLATAADGDARRALTVLEGAAKLLINTVEHEITVKTVTEALQWRSPRYDKSGEEHYNLISAYHKSMRGSDPQATLYWLARMIAGGEDPLYIARRTIRFAAEDVGLADPRALEVALAARQTLELLGSPEGELALAEAAVYLATAPKSNRVYAAWKAAQEAAEATPAAGVPLHIRNAPTGLMKELGYGSGYHYAHNDPSAYVPQEYLPDEVRRREFYVPGPFGFEKEIAKRLAWWNDLKRRGTGGAKPVAGDSSDQEQGPE